MEICGVISPILVNWALDGLEKAIQSCVKGRFYNPDKEKFLQSRNLIDPSLYKGSIRKQASSKSSF